jgi:hypothetical protein
MEAGINFCDPIEVAAGNDIVAFRKEFGKKMAYRGGVDKRVMAAGGTVLEKEINRLRPVIDSGGYIPGCDHGVPSDVSWDNYVLTTKLLAQATAAVKHNQNKRTINVIPAKAGIQDSGLAAGCPPARA